MGKILNSIKMLEYLSTGNKYSVKELAEKLNVTDRMIRYYKSELEENGIPIETFMGPGGGYYIINASFQYYNFNKYDVQLLENIFSYLKKNNYENCGKFEVLIDKMKHITDVEEDKSKYFVDSSCENDNKLYAYVKDAIVAKSKILIIYENINHEWQERYIHPMQIFEYKNQFYVTAFCELRNDIRHFEFRRMRINSKD